VCCVYITEERDSSKTEELSTDMSPLSVSKSSSKTEELSTDMSPLSVSKSSSKTKELSTDMSQLSVRESSTHTVCEMYSLVCSLKRRKDLSELCTENVERE